MPDHPAQPSQNQALPPVIEWVPLGTLTIYHVTEQELDQLEKGPPDSPYFGFAVFSFSTGLSFLVALLTTNNLPNRIYVTFLVVTLVGILAGAVLGFVWKSSQRSTKNIVNAIRRRKPPVGQQQG